MPAAPIYRPTETKCSADAESTMTATEADPFGVVTRRVTLPEILLGKCTLICVGDT
jgi:hypothetical protein